MAGTKGFRYVYSPQHIKTMLDKIQQSGRPDKLTFPYIRDNWLLKNQQYSAFLDLLKDMEFINPSGTLRTIPKPNCSETGTCYGNKERIFSLI